MSRINADMPLVKIISDMSDLVPGAMFPLMNILEENPSHLREIIYLDNMEIYGDNLYKLFTLCDKDIHKFILCIRVMQNSGYPLNKVHENLRDKKAISFLDEQIKLDGKVYDLDNDKVLDKSKFYEYCLEQRASYINRHPEEAEPQIVRLRKTNNDEAE